MLDHRALERLENYASFAELFRNDISFQKLIARENQARGYFIKSIGLLEDRSAGLIRNGAAKFERREIEQIDIGKPPRLIFTRWSRDRFKFFPRGMLLFAKPVRQIAQLK